MFAASSLPSNNNNTPSYIIPGVVNTTPIPQLPATNVPIDATPVNSTSPQILYDMKIVCIQRKKKTKRNIYLTFVETCPLTSSNDQPCIEVIRKANRSKYILNDCISYEYFDTVKNDFNEFIYAYFESFTLSIYFADDNLDKKTMIIKYLEGIHQNKRDNTNEVNNNISQDPAQNQPMSISTQQQQQSQQSPILPCSNTMETIIHTFDVNLIPFESIIPRDHILIGPIRLYFTTTDLYIASIDCNRQDLKVTIANQCPSKDKAILCIPYFTIKNYGNRSNIFLIELGKSTYGNGEIHMKCHSSSLASTIHLLVSPVIEERPLILSSAFQNQLLTLKRIEKSKNIQPPIQLNNDTKNQSILDTPMLFLKKKSIEKNQNDSQKASSETTTPTTDLKSHSLIGLFRALTKNVSNLRRTATFHSNTNNNNDNNTKNLHNSHSQTNNGNSTAQSEQIVTLNNSLLSKDRSIAFHFNENQLHNDQHQIILPESQKKLNVTPTTSTTLPKQPSETLLTQTSSIDANRQEVTAETYIDMGPTVIESEHHDVQPIKTDVPDAKTTATVDIGVNTTISLSPHVRSAIIVGNSVHLIADDKNVFPIGQRSFTSPASVMQPFKTQLTGQTTIHTYTTSADLVASSLNSSSSLHLTNSVSNSHQSLLLSYGIVTFKDNDPIMNDQNERATSPTLDGSMIDRRLNSNTSLTSIPQQQATFQQFDNISLSSNSYIIRASSISANNTVDTASGQTRTPHGSILFIDDHSHDQAATYLLGPPTSMNDETISTNISRLPSLNLSTSISRPLLSHIDEEKQVSHDPYALMEPISQQDSPKSVSSITLNNPIPVSTKSLDYADILLPIHLNNNENIDNNESEQINSIDTIGDENNFIEEQEREANEILSTKLYTDIDFCETQRRDRIIQAATRAKLEDKAPPFVL